MSATFVLFLNCYDLSTSIFFKLFDAGFDGFEFFVHLEASVDDVESSEAVIEIAAICTLAFGVKIVDELDGVDEVRNRLAHEVFRFIVEFFILTVFIVLGRNKVGLFDFVNSAVVEHFAKAEVGEELVGQNTE